MMEVNLSAETVKLLKKMMRDIIREELKAEKKVEWVSTEEAAKILGITPKHLRKIKDRFPCVKVGGDSGRGRIKFKKDSLIEDYVSYDR